MRRTFFDFLGIVWMWGSLPADAHAGSWGGGDRDGFSTSQIVHGHYFTLYAENDVDLQSLAMKLAVPSSIKVIIKSASLPPDSFSLQDQLDIFFLAVSEIMDIHLKKFHVEIKICKNAESLSRIASALFGQPIQPKAFYVVDRKSVV